MADESKLKKKLRASETDRVRLSRELDAARRDVVNGRGLLQQAEKEIKRLGKDRAALKLWTQERCTCGGDGPDTGCLACQAYHAANLGGQDE